MYTLTWRTCVIPQAVIECETIVFQRFCVDYNTLFREEDGEHENKTIWYYSTKVQLAELLEVLDKTSWEKQLCATLEELRDEIHTHMDITEELTNKARGNNKSYLTTANGKDQRANTVLIY